MNPSRIYGAVMILWEEYVQPNTMWIKTFPRFAIAAYRNYCFFDVDTGVIRQMNYKIDLRNFFTFKYTICYIFTIV